MRYSSQKESGTTKEHVRELIKKAEEGIERCRSSEGFRAYLKAQSKLHKQLAVAIASETGMLTEQMEEVARDAIVMKLSADLDRFNPECLTQLEELSKTSETAKELFEKAIKIADVSKFTTTHLSA